MQMKTYLALVQNRIENVGNTLRTIFHLLVITALLPNKPLKFSALTKCSQALSEKQWPWQHHTNLGECIHIYPQHCFYVT